MISNKSYETFNVWCSKCRKKTSHDVYFVSRTKGVKLHCGDCGRYNVRFFNFKRLKGGHSQNRIK